MQLHGFDATREEYNRLRSDFTPDTRRGRSFPEALDAYMARQHAAQMAESAAARSAVASTVRKKPRPRRVRFGPADDDVADE